MILDRIDQCDKYESLIPGLCKVLKTITELPGYEEGRYELDKGFYMIQKGTTTHYKDGFFETHKKYLDIQILLAGREVLEWETCEKLPCIQQYNEGKDLCLYKGEGVRMNIRPGMFYILFPEDAHKACCHEDRSTEYVKAVVKLPV